MNSHLVDPEVRVVCENELSPCRTGMSVSRAPINSYLAGAVWLKGAVWLTRVRCGSDSSAPACCTAGPSSNLGSAPQRRPSTERKAMRTTRVVLYE
jgi:hypothetical protein